MRNVATDELAQLRRSFDTCDSNGDGRIVVKEFAALLQGLDEDLTPDECLLAFEATDSDGDGTISFEEFVGWWTA